MKPLCVTIQMKALSCGAFYYTFTFVAKTLVCNHLNERLLSIHFILQNEKA